MTAATSIAINDHICGILLRYFRSAFQVEVGKPRVDLLRDMDLLRLHWSISPALRKLTDYIIANRHETQSFLTFRVSVEAGVVRGRLDARATMIRHILTGNTAETVALAPVRSFATGPNHVVAWVLQQAWLLSGRFLSLLPEATGYRLAVEDEAQRLEKVRKIEAIRTAMAETNLSQRPGRGSLQEAARSRKGMYRLAHHAFMDLVAIESGDLNAIERMLRATLLGPLDEWQRFELAVGLGLADSLEKMLQTRAVFNVLQGESKAPLARIGRFSVFWQNRRPLGIEYIEAEPEPAEQIVQSILSTYGLQASSDRPDLVVADMEAGKVVAVIEVKFFGGEAEDRMDRVRAATEQLVRYSRGYRPLATISELLDRSVIALISNAVEIPSPRPVGVPIIVDFEDIRQGRLSAWAGHLLHL
jgi:hypothetical protein